MMRVEMTGPVSVELWFEFASTYSYLAVLRAPVWARRAGVSLVRRPFLLGPIFRELGFQDSPFNLYPVKGQYMWRDMARRARRYGLPFVRPSEFPRRSLTAARIALVAETEGWGDRWAEAVFGAEFAEDRDIGHEEELRALLRALGRDPREVLAAATSDENKAALRAETERARALGIFGAPSFVVGDELFWGDDRLEDAFDYAARAAVG